MNELKKIAETVQQVAEAISAALNIDVEIVDTENVRIGATGQIKPNIGKKQKYGHIARFVMQSGKIAVIDSPGFHDVCVNCELQRHCYYKWGITYPVSFQNRVIGIISLITFEGEKKKQISENQAQFTEFIEKMAELLSDKVAKQFLHDMLELRTQELDTVLDSVYEGVIVSDSQENISYVNKFAQLHLGLIPDNVIGKPVSLIIQGSLLTEAIKKRQSVPGQKVVYRTKGSEVFVYSRAFTITVNNQFKGAVEAFQLTEDLHKIAGRLEHEGGTGLADILGFSPQIKELKQFIPRLAESPSNVMVTGETGTGKELIARAIHDCGPRRKQPFISINCSAIPEPLLESELFGYESGAFTGAKVGGKPGKFELADKGTLFLDEIGDMPIYMQAKLLRVLQERKIDKLGGRGPIPVDVRIIAATHKNFEQMVQNKEFREDLYYRLNVIPIQVPSLRERMEDIPLLVEHFVEKSNRKLQKKFIEYDERLIEVFMAYPWPGNIRELENTIEYMCNLESDYRLGTTFLPERIRKAVEKRELQPKAHYSLKHSVEEAEREVLSKVLAQYSLRSDIDKILKVLDISRATLYRKLKEYELSQN